MYCTWYCKIFCLCLLHCIGVDHLISSGSGQLLCIRRRGNLLPLHEVRSPIHICPLHDHSDGARRGTEEGVGDALRNAAHGTGIPWKHCLPKQTGGCEFMRRFCRVSIIYVVLHIMIHAPPWYAWSAIDFRRISVFISLIILATFEVICSCLLYPRC